MDKKKEKLNKPFHATQFRLKPGESKKTISKEEYVLWEQAHAKQVILFNK